MDLSAFSADPGRFDVVSLRIRDCKKPAMSLISEFRSSLENPQTPLSYPAEWLLDMVNGGRTDSGIRVSETTALQVTTVFACVQLISSALGFLPFHVYEQLVAKDKRAAKRLAADHDLYDLLRFEPNDEMTSFTFRKTMQCHALLWSNCYAEIQRDNGNRALALWPRNPARIRPYRLLQPLIAKGERYPAGSMVYKTTEGMEAIDLDPENPQYRETVERIIPKEDVLHIPGMTFDGRVAPSVVQLARQAIGLAMATEKYGAKFFANGARPGGIIEHPGRLTDIARDNMKKSWQESQGGENIHRPAILEEGVKWKEASSKMNEAQFLETRQFQKIEICSVFSVPPHMIGESKVQNRSNVEQMSIEFVTFTLSPWLEAWQQEIRRKLFPKPASTGRPGKRFFVKFETRQLTMPDADSLRNFMATIKQWGIGSTNDMREWLDWNPVDDPDADALWMPINMQLMGAEAPEGGADQGSVPGSTSSRKWDFISQQRFLRPYSRLFRDAVGRIVARSKPDADAFRRAFLPVLGTVAGMLAEMAGQEFNCAPPAIDESRFLLDYIEGMRARSADWRSQDSNLEDISRFELTRAVKAILIEAYREAGTERAKDLTAPRELIETT
jgi:HK97 family phage portal protein